MGFISKFFNKFKEKEEINEETVIEKVLNEKNTQAPLIVEGDGNSPVMVRADEFADSSTVPEEYDVVSDDVVQELEDSVDHGIEVVDGDSMTPIIMNVDDSEKIEQVVEENLNVVQEVNEIVEEVKVTESEEDEDIEILQILVLMLVFCLFNKNKVGQVIVLFLLVMLK